MISVPGPDRDRDARLNAWIAGLADRCNAPVAHRHIRLDDPPMVEDQRVGDHGVRCALRPRGLALTHAVADDLAAAEFHLLAVDREIALYLDDKRRIGQPDTVSRRRAEHVGIGGAWKCGWHGRSGSVAGLS